jgi:hypothetical protein
MTNTKHKPSFYVALIMSVMLCVLSNISRSEEFVKNDLLESMELQKIVDNLTKKDLFPSSPPYPHGEDFKKLDKFIDANLQQLDICWFRLTFTKIEEEKTFNGKKTDQVRKDKCEAFLALSKIIHDLTDPEYVAQPVFDNIFPEPDESDRTNQLLLPNIPPSDIKNSKTRQKYEEALWVNRKNILEYNIQRMMSDLKPKVRRVFLEYVLKTYSDEPRADQELINLLEKYKYPEVAKVELLLELNIPYKGIRNWESTDKLFKATAKFISLDDKGEVTLEKANGKQTTIELSVLRKEDQDYVKEQLKPNEAPDSADEPFKASKASLPQPELVVMRTWTSRDGKFSVQAKYVSADETTVVIEKENGAKITVEISKLSEPDQKYIERQRDAKKQTEK